jgi:hypothetical protein
MEARWNLAGEIAVVCSWHEHHKLAANKIDYRLARREKIIVAAESTEVKTYFASFPCYFILDGSLIVLPATMNAPRPR